MPLEQDIWQSVSMHTHVLKVLLKKMRVRKDITMEPTALTQAAFKNTSKSHIVPKDTESLELKRTDMQLEYI